MPYKVVIDPGHGGDRHPGAVSKLLHLLEKDLTLDFSNALMDRLSKGDYLYQAFPTRVTDSYRSLQHRCDIANKLEADVFMSIHHNARPFRGKPGLEIETYHFPGSLKGRRFAWEIHDYLVIELGKNHKIIDREVKEKGFYVLKHTIMPAILLEIGFITDPEEAIWLTSAIHQREVAGILAEALELYLEDGPGWEY